VSIKPIDHNLTSINSLYQSKDKQQDFNKVKDTNTFLQNNSKVEIERDMSKIKNAEETLGKKIAEDGGKKSSSQEKSNKRQKKNKPNTEKDKVPINEEGKGLKLDLFI